MDVVDQDEGALKCEEGTGQRSSIDTSLGSIQEVIAASAFSMSWHDDITGELIAAQVKHEVPVVDGATVYGIGQRSSIDTSLESIQDVIGASAFSMSWHNDITGELIAAQVKHEEAVVDGAMVYSTVKLEPFITQDLNIKEEVDEHESSGTESDSPSATLQDSAVDYVRKPHYECATCGNSFTRKDNLEKHLKLHTGKKLYKCSICNRAFAEKSTLKVHGRTHTGEKPYKCTTCKRKFSHLSSLKQHSITHTDEKPYKCTTCGRAFSAQSSLKTHLRIHTGVMPYECARCNCKFALNATLRTHIRTHTGEKPYQCTTCNCAFSHRSTFKRHLKTHTGKTPFQCATCRCKFSVKRTLDRHIRTRSCKRPS